jgi:uncharacterized protein (TIGR02147 family)
LVDRKESTTSVKESKAERPNVFCYHDYRSFLRDWISHLKDTLPRFSLRKLSSEAGLSPGYLPLVLGGSISISMKAVTKLVPVLRLDPRERVFFENLVKLCISESSDARIEALGRMQKFAKYRRHNPADAEFANYMTRWLNIAIREMALLPDFIPNPTWIQEKLRLRVSLEEIEETLSFLTKNNYLELRPDGSVVPSKEFLKCSGEVHRTVLVHYHKEMFSLAAQSIDNATGKERSLVGQTFVINDEHFATADKILREALEKIRNLGESGTTNSVYHLEFALFPITKKGEAV